MDWNRLADDAMIERTAKALRSKGVEVFIVANRSEAKKKALDS
jgi:glutamyl-tRNA reductase